MATFQFKRGSASIWKEKNLVLAAGEPGFEKDTNRLKIGDGSTSWNNLKYFGIIRRDNAANYSANYVPIKGEILLVDVAGEGLKMKVGDGSTAYKDLPYEFDPQSRVKIGYYKDGKFYSDNQYTQEITPTVGVIYIDQSSSKLYSTDGQVFGSVVGDLPIASSEIAGITKLYDATGDNTDGAMTQKATTFELNKKVEVSVKEDTERLVFS